MLLLSCRLTLESPVAFVVAGAQGWCLSPQHQSGAGVRPVPRSLRLNKYLVDPDGREGDDQGAAAVTPSGMHRITTTPAMPASSCPFRGGAGRHHHGYRHPGPGEEHRHPAL